MLTTTAQRREWLGLLEAELARRTTQAEWEAGQDERLRQQLLGRLWEMAQRLKAGALVHPLQIDDMSCAEMLACRFLPERLRPAGLGTEDEIFALAAARGGLK
jgi:hypothetical protein